MDKRLQCGTRVSILLAFALALPAQASPYLDGTVGYDYYVSGVDPDGYEFVDADLYAERVVNDSSQTSDPLSLAGWLTRDPDPAGEGVEAGYLPLGRLPGYGSTEASGTVPADDVRPGEYFVHMLLQDDNYPGSFEDYRELPPTLLWRGGLEAVGPLRLYQYDSGRLDVDFDRLDNRRIDSRYTNDIALTLFATYGFGPASDGLELCRVIVPGLYAGDSRFSPGFSCYPDSLPDGEYSLHLEVAELGGRGGYSTLSGPDTHFHGGWMIAFHGCGSCFSSPPVSHYDVVYAAGFGLSGLLPLALLGLRRARRASRVLLAGLLLLPGAAFAAPAHSDFSDAELDQLLAPIALYPDSVLSNVMIAATYPLEVAQAARWSRQHRNLKGEAAVDAVARMDWDASVKALVAFPEILDRMDEDLDWTERLGEAFLAQEADVMDRVQYLRHRADDEGQLEDTEQVRVVREREVIYVEPAVSRWVYVPYYDPWVVYGSWWWPAYPPHCWAYWGGYPAAYYHRYYAPFYWGAALYVWPGFYYSAFSWHHHYTVVVPYYGWNRSAHVVVRHEGAQRWQHDERHRRDVEYRHPHLSHRSDGYRMQREQAISHSKERSYRTPASGPTERNSRPQRHGSVHGSVSQPTRSYPSHLPRYERRDSQSQSRLIQPGSQHQSQQHQHQQQQQQQQPYQRQHQPLYQRQQPQLQPPAPDARANNQQRNSNRRESRH